MNFFKTIRPISFFFIISFILSLLSVQAQTEFTPFPMDQNAGDEFEAQDTKAAWWIFGKKKTYIIGTLSPLNTINYNRPTHIVTAGSAKNKESDQFFQSAYLRARIYRELYPYDQVIILSQPEVKRESNKDVYKRYKITIVKEKKGTLTGPKLIREMNKFKNIKSFDFYGHSSPWGLKVGKKNASMGANGYTAKLRDNFTKDAYATLNGCNGGFILAPGLSKLWNIPVSGALTGSLFERLQADGKWYKRPDRVESQATMENTFNLRSDLHCYAGGCWRMKPQRNNYSSYWGKFKEGGLSFYKFFCNFNATPEKCQKVMAKSLLSFPTSERTSSHPSWENFEKRIFDYLCSTSRDPSYFRKCRDGIKETLRQGEKTFQIHPGNALHCDFKSCYTKVRCEKGNSGGFKAGSCRLSTHINKNPTTLIREYLAYKKGYELLFPDAI